MELIKKGISRELIYKKDIRNIYIVKKVVERYDWQKAIGRKIDLQEEIVILNMLLSKGILNSGQTLISNLIRKLEDKEISEQEIYALILNLGINGVLNGQKGCSYSTMLNGATDLAKLELPEEDKRVTIITILKMKSETINEEEQEKLIQSMIDLGIPKEFLEKKNIRNIYMAKEMVERYNWEGVIGRKIKDEERRHVIQSVLSCGSLDKQLLINLIKKIQLKGMNEQEIYGTIINLSIKGMLNNNCAYSYSYILRGGAIEELQLTVEDTTVTEETLIKAEKNVEKLMKKLLVKMKKSDNLSQVSSTLNGLEELNMSKDISSCIGKD